MRRTNRRSIIGPRKAPTLERRKFRDPCQKETFIPFLAGSVVNQRVPVTRMDIQVQGQESTLSTTEAHVLVRKHTVDPITAYKKVPTFVWSEALSLVMEALLADTFWESPYPRKHVVFPIIWLEEAWSRLLS